MQSSSDGPSQPLLAVRDVSMAFYKQGEPVFALENTSIDVRQGELISVIGPSGCGKSTLFKIIGGLVSPSQGNVTLDGSAVTGPRRDIGMMFQEESTFPWRTAIDNVAFPLEVTKVAKGERRDRAEQALKMVGLEGFERHYPSELSGGMRQRVALARTLISQPRLLLMDEPFAALDEQTRLLLGDQILHVQQQLSQTALLITHNITEAIQLSDRVAVMSYRPGRIKRIVDLDLPRPRTSEIVGSKQFAHYVALIWKDLREEANRGMLAAEQAKRAQ